MSPLEFFLGDRLLARVVLISFLGAFYAGAILLNNELLFPFADVGGSVFWFFFPEGIKFLLVMSLGVRGAAAVGLGRAAVTLNQYPDIDYLTGLTAGAVMALSTLAAMTIGTRLVGVSFPWREIKMQAMFAIAFTFALTDAASKIFAEFYIIGNKVIQNADLSRLFAIEAVGRLAGIFVFLWLVNLIKGAIAEVRLDANLTRK